MQKVYMVIMWLACTYSVLFRFVCGAVEFVEQEEEHESVHSDPPDERSRIVALDEQQLERMYHDRDELHLKKRFMFIW